MAFFRPCTPSEITLQEGPVTGASPQRQENEHAERGRVLSTNQMSSEAQERVSPNLSFSQMSR